MLAIRRHVTTIGALTLAFAGCLVWIKSQDNSRLAPVFGSGATYDSPSTLPPTTGGNAKNFATTLIPFGQATPEYLIETDDQRICNSAFGPEYLKYIASHQRPYCEPQSLANVQCFTTHRLTEPWEPFWDDDQLCLAQGVLYNPATSPENGQPSFRMQCDPRNFTRESMASEAAAKELGGVRPLTNMSVYWYDTGVGAAFKEWQFASKEDAAGCTAANGNNEWIILARREGNDNIWHKLMEIWQARLTFDALRLAVHPTTGKPWLSSEQAATVRVVIDDDRTEQFDDLWNIVTGNLALRRSDLVPGTCYGNVVIPLAGSSSPFWQALIEIVYHETCRTTFLMNAFLRRVFDHYAIKPRPAIDFQAEPTITIIDRRTRRKLYDQEALVEAVRTRYPNSTVRVEDLATLSFRQQIELVQSTDVLVGHHGAGMAHVLFMPIDSAVVEYLPPWFPIGGFRSIGRMRGLAYFTGHAVHREEWEHTVKGVPLPEGWTRPQNDWAWQESEWVYILEEDLLGMIDAAVRNQRNRLFDRPPQA